MSPVTRTLVSWRGWLFIALMWLSGCAAADEANMDPSLGATPQCYADAQCPSALRCDSGVCVERRERATAVSFLFIPPPASGYLPQRIDGLELMDGEPLDFSLTPSVIVEGDVSTRDSASGNTQVLTTGTLLFERKGDGDEQLVRQVRLTEPRFELDIRPGNYAITYLPADESRLGWRWTEQAIEAHTSLSLTMADQGRSAVLIEGKLTHRDGLIPSEALAALGVGGARVYAVSRRTGLSTTAAITNEVGEFRILAWPDSGSYDLHVGAAEPNTLAPRAVFASAFEVKRDAVTVSAELGAYPALSRSAPIRLALSAQTLAALDATAQEISVTARAQLERGELRITRRLSADGSIDLTLLPMRYTLTITPPRTSRFGPAELTLDLSNLQNLQIGTAELPLRRRVRGQLVTATNAPAKRAQLRVMSAAGEQSRRGEGAREAAAATFMTDERGRFEVWVDAGEATRWQIIPDGSSLAPRSIYELEAGADDLDDLLINLPAPSLISGSVRGDDLSPQADVSIQVMTMGDTPRVIAEGTTDRQGRFKLLSAY